MPSRVVRAEINSSASLSQVSPEAELVFRALLLAVDDYGRIDGRPDALKASLFPMRAAFTAKKIAAWIDELAALPDPPVRMYEVDGRRYLWLPNWEKHRSGGRRADHSRFPAPPEASQEILGNPRKPQEILPRVEGRGTYDEGRGTTGAAPAEPVAPRAPKVEVSEEAKTLTRGFLDSRAVPFPAARPPTPSAYAAWERDMDRLLRLDHRTGEQVIRLVRWLYDPSQSASPDSLFWRANIQSVSTLREKWDRLEAIRTRGATNGKQTLASAAENIQRRFAEHLAAR